MKRHDLTQPSTLLNALPILGGVVLASGLFTACGGGAAAPLSSVNANVVTAQPDPSIGSEFFIGDTHFNGEASTLSIIGISWGRLVNVAEDDGTIVMRDFLISNGIRDGGIFLPSLGDPIVYDLSRNPVTDQFVLRIPVNAGTLRFEEALANLEANLTPVFDKSLDPDEVGPFSMVPRNATAMIHFSDLLEPVFDNGAWQDLHGGAVVNSDNGQLNKDLIKVSTGYPPVSPYEARVFVDPNHGNLLDRDLDGVGEFYSTRVLISPTISPIESQGSNPPLGINSVGLPASLVTDDANLAFRIPTLVNSSVGQTFILRSAGGKVVSYSGNGSTNNDSGTLDVVRGLRSGGGDITGDPNNGFLLDEDDPKILGDFSVAIVGTPFVAAGDPPYRYTLPGLTFDVVGCQLDLKLGDVIIQSGVSGLVVCEGGSNSTCGLDLKVDVIAPSGGVFVAGSARLQTPFDLTTAVDKAPCFLRFSPIPLAPPASGIQPDSAVFIRFSEPMDPESIKPFDSFSINRDDGSGSPDTTGFGYAIGRVVPESDLRTFRWDHPAVPFHHVAGAVEKYFVRLASGANGPTDLAGRSLDTGLPEVEFEIDLDAPEGKNAGFALRFANLPDDLFDDGKPELRAGQLLYDPVNERILPRPVNRFSSAADTNQPLPAVMTPFVGGIQTPLSNLGSKLHTLWRYVDVGFSLTDETNYNIDVEGLSWAPAGGFIVADAFNEFSIGLAHSQFLPDEVLNPNSGFPSFPGSGLKQGFANNFNDSANDPGTIVHDRSLGYVVNPSNLYTATSGTPMLPFPMNEDKVVADYSFYTWRDTALTGLGAPSGAGAILAQENAIVFGGQATAGQPYPPSNVPTVGLPLLMEFRCYPADEALGLNALDIALAANSSARPNFRAFSTGGFDGNQLVFVNPDNNDVAQGGWNPATNNATPGTDNTFYKGEMALVTRVSRVHSIWFDTGSGATTYAQPVVEPEVAELPLGTSIVLAFRGAINVTNADLLSDATSIDPYGDQLTGSSVTFLGGDKTWKDDITQINSARYFQVRISFVSNADTERTADLRTLAFAYYKG